jgi:hypothetical protein
LCKDRQIVRKRLIDETGYGVFAMATNKKRRSAPFDANCHEINVELRDKRNHPGSPEYWPLAVVEGGIDRITVEREGNTTIIKIVSPEGHEYADPVWERPKGEWRSLKGPNSEPQP